MVFQYRAGRRPLRSKHAPTVLPLLWIDTKHQFSQEHVRRYYSFTTRVLYPNLNHVLSSSAYSAEFQEWMPLYWLEYHCSELFNGLSKYTFTSKFDHPNNLGPITILTYKLNQQPTTASKSSLFLDACNLKILSSSVMNTNAIKNSHRCLFP